MSKYIIRNCPCYTTAYHCKYNCSGKTLSPYCQDCTDCVIKQIVGYCLDQNLKCDTTACDILDMLDIQEVE